MPVAAQFSSNPSAVVTTDHVRAELIAQAPDGVQPGAPVWVGLKITHQPGWHTYWKNAGDSGLATELQWQLPAGVSAGDIAWPVPEKIRIGPLANYGYEGTVLLPVPLSVAPGFKTDLLAGSIGNSGMLDVKLHANWLVCEKECIPEEGDFALKLPLTGSTALNGAEFDAALAAEPHALADGAGKIAVQGQRLAISVDGLPEAARGKSLALFPETGEVIHNAAALGKDWTQAWDGARWTASVPLAEQRSESPRAMPLVLALAPKDRQAGSPIAWRVVAPVSGDWPQSAAKATVSPALATALAANASSKNAAGIPAVPQVVASSGFAALALALVGALVGGLLLNLMPCVFPVLAIKVLALTRHAQDRQAHRRAALAYTAGVLASVLALAGLMLALRAAGTQLGWGFQLQSPVVVAALAALFTLIGLNLAGVFEFGNVAPAGLGAVQARHPVANDFLSGVLVVVVASPCTAPFLGASLGLAIALPAAEALLLFAALGLGLALPYLVAGFVPAIARWMPKPGAWMVTLRRLLAFPMFATVAWLVWVLGQQSGIDGAGALLALLVALAAVVWSLTLRGRTRIAIASISIAVSALLAAAIGRNVIEGAPPAGAVAEAGARWQPWSVAAVDTQLAAGRPVFIDFTAAWCVTCQVNKKTTLADAGVLAAFDAKKVAMLRADWTRREPAITKALAALGRNGVPVYVLQAPGKAPMVLTELLGKAELRDKLAAL